MIESSGRLVRRILVRFRSLGKGIPLNPKMCEQTEAIFSEIAQAPQAWRAIDVQRVGKRLSADDKTRFIEDFSSHLYWRAIRQFSHGPLGWSQNADNFNENHVFLGLRQDFVAVPDSAKTLFVARHELQHEKQFFSGEVASTKDPKELLRLEDDADVAALEFVLLGGHLNPVQRVVWPHRIWLNQRLATSAQTTPVAFFFLLLCGFMLFGILATLLSAHPTFYAVLILSLAYFIFSELVFI